MDARDCIFCKTSFIPNKYSPRQKVCSNPDCQKKRQLESMKVWRQSHPDYFKFDESKGSEWLETQRQRSREWRRSNPDKVKAYRQKHLGEYRRYMREYMRKHRQKLKQSGQEPPATPAPPA